MKLTKCPNGEYIHIPSGEIFTTISDAKAIYPDKVMIIINDATPQFRNPQVAFNEAILSGRLTTYPKANHYAGNYMYMHTGPDGRDYFKNIITRLYDI